MIDFTELPEDGVKFEQLIRELLVLEGFEVHWTGVGPDGGRDLLLTEKLEGPLSDYERKWLVSCKHYATSGKSVGRDEAGSITENCRAVNADGYILACSTQPTASLVTRLEEIEKNQKIITKFWDSIEIEKRLSKPNTFSLIHTFFPNSAKNYEWKIYNAFSPSFWAANYKSYFLYMCCRHSNEYPYLQSIEAIVTIIERVPIFKDEEHWWNSQYIRLRAVYFDDKHSTHTVYIDYIYPQDKGSENIIQPLDLERELTASFTHREHKIMNEPTWDVIYLAESTGGDSFQLDHKSYYEPYMDEFASGSARKQFLNNWVYEIRQIEAITGKSIGKII